MGSARDQLIETTCELLEQQGYHATGLNQIVSESGTPKGSLYYYFPEGKEELTEEAIRRAGRIVAERIERGLAGGEDAPDAIRSFVQKIAYHVETSGFRAGGPLMIVAMETVTSSERLNLACREAYSQVQGAFREKLLAHGYPQARAEQLAQFITASIEGGTILSRTSHSGEPLRNVAELLWHLLKTQP